MNEIMKLKQKYSAPTSDMICELINHRISASESSMRDMELQLAEGKQKIEDQARELSAMRDELDNKNRVLDEKAKELKTEKEKLHDLEKENLRIQKNNYSLKKKIEKLRVIKPNVSDQKILDLGDKKCKLYKELTRIRWDYGALDQEMKGFITDKKKYLRTFSYPKSMENSEMSDLMWKEIQLSTGKDLEDDSDTENTPSNRQ